MNLNYGLTRAESDLADVISEADRERIMETERTLMESSMCSGMSGGESDGEDGRSGGRRGSVMVQGRKSNRRRRRLPEIPKNKKRKLIHMTHVGTCSLHKSSLDHTKLVYLSISELLFNLTKGQKLNTKVGLHHQPTHHTNF